MAYSILVRDAKDSKMFRFLTVKEEVTQESVAEETDESTGEVKEVVTSTPTGEYQTVKYQTDDKAALEEKYIALLDSYSRSQIIPVRVEDYALDMVFDSDE